MSKIDLSRTVYDLTEEHPGIIPLLEELGFKGIVKPVTRRTIGKRMTIPAGCKVRKVPLAVVMEKLRDAGYEVQGSAEHE